LVTASTVAMVAVGLQGTGVWRSLLEMVSQGWARMLGPFILGFVGAALVLERIRPLTTGLFEFKLGFVSGRATLTVVAECLATVVLVTGGGLLWRETA
jgi:hypothetical protein